MAPKPSQEQIDRIRRAALSGVPKRDVLRVEGMKAWRLEALAKAHGIIFAKVAKRVTAEDIGAYDREATLVRAKEILAQEVGAARLEIEEGSAPPYKGRDWG